MTNTTTLSSFQAAQTDAEQQPERAGFDLANLAQRMVRERSDNPEVGDPFAGMSLDVDPADAFGLVQANVTAWLEEHGRWASPIEISHKAEQLIADAKSARPGPVKAATYTVEGGVVTSFVPDAAPSDLPWVPDEEPAIGGLRVPKSTEFDADGWADSTALWQRAQALIERHPDELEHLEGMTLSFLWRLKGGKSRGRPVYGQCVKAGGLLKHFATSTFLIWLAADHVLAARYGDRQIEALLFRQLLAAGVADVDENTGRGGGATLVPPDVQAYAAELRVYGAWESTLKSAAQAFRQAPLFFEGQPVDRAAEEPVCEIDQSDNLLDGAPPLDLSGAGAEIQPEPLVCSVCGNAVDEEELSLEEVSEARQNPAVVLCEACGEDGVIDEDDDDNE